MGIVQGTPPVPSPPRWEMKIQVKIRVLRLDVTLHVLYVALTHTDTRMCSPDHMGMWGEGEVLRSSSSLAPFLLAGVGGGVGRSMYRFSIRKSWKQALFARPDRRALHAVPGSGVFFFLQKKILCSRGLSRVGFVFLWICRGFGRCRYVRCGGRLTGDK